MTKDEETSDCPLLTPSPPPDGVPNSLDGGHMYDPHSDSPTPLDQTLGNIISGDGLAFLNLVNSSCKPLHDGKYNFSL